MPENTFRLHLRHHNLSAEDEVERQYAKFIAQVDNNRQVWAAKNNKIFRARRGVRGEKTYPWKGAANVHLPLIESQIREAKPIYVGLEFMAHPICAFRGPDLEENRAMETWFDWLYRVRMTDTFAAACSSVDDMLTWGNGVREVMWRYQESFVNQRVTLDDILDDAARQQLSMLLGDEQASAQEREAVALQFIGTRLGVWLGADPEDPELVEKVRRAAGELLQGSDDVLVEYTTVLHDEPHVVSVDPHDIFVPAPTLRLQDAEWMSHRFYMAEHELQLAPDMYGWREGGVEAFLKQGRKKVAAEPDARDRSRETAEGYSRSGDTDLPFVLHKTLFWQDVNGDGRPERVEMVHDPKNGIILDYKDYPHPVPRWNYVQYPFEISDQRWFGVRGMGELLYDLQMEMVQNHNGMLNARDSAAIPMFTVPRAPGYRADQLRFSPGVALPTPVGYQPTQIAGQFNPQGHYQQEMVLRGWAEKLSGRHDISMFSEQNPPERRTATEIQAAMQAIGQIATLDSLVYQQSNRDLFWLIKTFWATWGPDEAEYMIEGRDVVQRMSRSRVAKKYELMPTGTPTNTILSIRINQAMQIMQTAAPWAQYGVFGADELRELLKQIAQMVDPVLAKKVFRDVPGGRMEQMEEQIKEILIMKDGSGFVPQPSASDDDEAHIMAIDTYVQAAGGELDEKLLQMIQAHREGHMQRRGGSNGSGGAQRTREPARA